MSKKIIENTLWGEKTEITPELLEYYRHNPKELDLIVDKEYFYGRFIRFFFIIGIIITVASRILMLLFQDTDADFINDLILDIFSELGIAIFGGAIAAYILEKMKLKQYEDNITLRNEIIEKLNEKK